MAAKPKTCSPVSMRRWRSIPGSTVRASASKAAATAASSTNWLITQTDRFKAAIPAAGISNLVSFNYMAYYHDYLAVEFGALPARGVRTR